MAGLAAQPVCQLFIRIPLRPPTSQQDDGCRPIRISIKAGTIKGDTVAGLYNPAGRCGETPGINLGRSDVIRNAQGSIMVANVAMLKRGKRTNWICSDFEVSADE